MLSQIGALGKNRDLALGAGERRTHPLESEVTAQTRDDHMTTANVCVRQNIVVFDESIKHLDDPDVSESKSDVLFRN